MPSSHNRGRKVGPYSRHPRPDPEVRRLIPQMQFLEAATYQVLKPGGLQAPQDGAPTRPWCPAT